MGIKSRISVAGNATLLIEHQPLTYFRQVNLSFWNVANETEFTPLQLGKMFVNLIRVKTNIFNELIDLDIA